MIHRRDELQWYKRPMNTISSSITGVHKNNYNLTFKYSSDIFILYLKATIYMSDTRAIQV